MKKVFDVPEVQAKFKDSKDNMFRLLYFLFVYNRNDDLHQYILSLLTVSDDVVIKLLDHRIKPPSEELRSDAIRFHKIRIIQELARYNSLPDLQSLITIITEKVFIKQVFINDEWNVNVLDSGKPPLSISIVYIQYDNNYLIIIYIQ